MQGPDGEDGDDEVADEELAVLGVDAVGEDEEAEDGDDGDDGAFCPSAEGLGGGDAVGLGEVRLEVFLGVVGALLGEGEGADDGQEGGDGRDPAAGFEVDDAAEFDGDRDDGVPGDAEAAEGEQGEGCVVASWYEPAEASDAVGGEGEEGGEDSRR